MRIRSWFGLMLALAMCSVTAANAAQWQTQSFELRLDRLYFSAGEELLIFEDAPFVILRIGDTVYSGLIEHSWEGVSVSATTNGFFDTIPLVGLSAAVRQAEIDTDQTITVGSDVAGLPIRADSLDQTRVKWVEYRDGGAMREDFASGVIDAMVTMSDLRPRPYGGVTLSAPCPFLAVMTPQVGLQFNYHGELTTSLYYRFDDSRLALCFQGDGAQTVNRLFSSPPGSSTPRWYDFDPVRGKKLFDRISPRPSRLRLHSSHPILDGVARYFADLLARDRCAVELTADPMQSDVAIRFVPYCDSNPRIVADSIYAMMVRDTVAGSPPAEYLRRIGLELRGLDITLQPDDSVMRLEAIDRILAEDLGLFPLFRPTLFVHTRERLRGVRMTRDGRADFAGSVRVVLPATLLGGAR
jgi:hypothetical protein